MSEMYDALAPIYDALNSEIDYKAWADALVTAMETHATRPIKQIADIGCGTGSMTFPLAARGYEVIGVDLSAEMLNVAYQRQADAHKDLSVQFVMQDMTALDLGAPVDAVVCTLDGLNHLPGREALAACFRSVGEWLAPGGVFLFDLNSKFKFENIYADEAYTYETANAFCVWQNDYHPSGQFCDFFITLFEMCEDGRYRRSDTVQREYYFSRRTVERALADAGMRIVSCAGGTDGHAVQNDDERWYFTAVKG